LLSVLAFDAISPPAFGADAAAGAASWKTGDKVEVKWGGTWYPAVILEVKEDIFKIHYDGYGSNWDEWVGSDRIRSGPAAAPAVPVASDSAWKVGDKVEAWNVAWFPAEILAVGTGERQGYYRVHYSNFSDASDQWLKADSIRARESGGAGTTGAATPRIGRYRVLSAGAGGKQLMLGELELLANGRYIVRLPGGRVRGEGKYAFDSTTATVKWLTGPYREDGFGGTFEVSREGRTHEITLRRGTIAANSVE
jgi:hypothetical protein